MNKQIPILDFSGLQSSDAITQAELVAQVADAARDIGFFYVRNSGITPERVATIFKHAHEFFALPIEVKQSLACNDTNHGYDGLEGQKFDKDKPGDLKEAFRFGAEPNKERIIDPALAWSSIINQPNKWPVDIPELRTDLLSFVAESTGVVDDILLLLEGALGERAPDLRAKHRKHDYTMMLLRYPQLAAGEVKEGQERCGQHTDWGTITLLFQDDNEGLEVSTRQGEWLAVQPQADSILVNIGDQLELWTQGELVSTPHRVRSNVPGKSLAERYSIAFFCVADYDAELPLMDARTSGEYILSKIQTTYKFSRPI
jgi:isopenicillin N synthase-like dioxygenase